MAYIYFVLAGICFLIVAVLEINKRKKSLSVSKPSVSRTSTKKYYDVRYEEGREEKPTTLAHEGRREDDEQSGGKFDHLFRIKPEKEEAKKSHLSEQIVKEAELMPEIPKIGKEDKFEPLYFRVGENAREERDAQEQSTSSLPQDTTQQGEVKESVEDKPQPRDWLFFDPSTLESKDNKEDEQKKEKKDDSWTPAFFFGDES